MRIRDLLVHRSGLGLGAGDLLYWPTTTYSNREVAERLRDVPLSGGFRERYAYDNILYGVAQLVIEQASGQSYEQFLRSRIFEPLGMADTGFLVAEDQLGRLPACYGSDMSTGKLVKLYEAGRGYASQAPVFESGAGGLVSTADDLLAFGLMMLMRRGERILSRPTIELMTTDQLTAAQKANSPFFPHFWDAHGWGLGLAIVTARDDVADVPGRFGWDGAFGTSFWMDPGEELVGVLLTQASFTSAIVPPVVRDFWTSAYQLIAD